MAPPPQLQNTIRAVPRKHIHSSAVASARVIVCDCARADNALPVGSSTRAGGGINAHADVCTRTGSVGTGIHACAGGTTAYTGACAYTGIAPACFGTRTAARGAIPVGTAACAAAARAAARGAIP
eukprot:41418-Chlamydomonas_euryale.AAC.1